MILASKTAALTVSQAGGLAEALAMLLVNTPKRVGLVLLAAYLRVS